MALFERATAHAGQVLAQIGPQQLTHPTPCTEWSVQDLIEHLVGSTDYLLGAAGTVGRERSAPATAEDYRTGVARVLDALGRPDVPGRRCLSRLGFQWSVTEAIAGTFMDHLIHTWDVAVATGQDHNLDDELVEACVAMFLPEMPEHGRASGLVGPVVAVPAGASAQDRLLGAMGRRP